MDFGGFLMSRAITQVLSINFQFSIFNFQFILIIQY